MKLRALGALLIAVGAVSFFSAAHVSVAAATRLVDPSGQPVDPGLQAVPDSSRVPTWPGTVRFFWQQDCPDPPVGGDCSHPWDVTPVIWVSTAPPDALGVQDRLELMHELGHVFDYKVLAHERGAHAKLERALHRTGPWWGVKGDESPPGEQFAVAYSFCATGAPLRLLFEFSYYDYRPRRAQQGHVCALIRTAALGP